MSCPYLYCNSKNSQFQHAGRFPSGIVMMMVAFPGHTAPLSSVPGDEVWILTVVRVRVCAQPPPLLPQAPPVQWGLPGHDDGGAAGRGRDQQQHYQVPRELVVRSLIFILFSVSCCRKAGSISSLNGTEIKWVSNLFRFLWVNNSFRWHLVAGKLAPYPTSTAQIPKKKISSYPPDHPRHKPGPSWRWVILLNASNDNLKF